jgi:hypothetical protein
MRCYRKHDYLHQDLGSSPFRPAQFSLQQNAMSSPMSFAAQNLPSHQVHDHHKQAHQLHASAHFHPQSHQRHHHHSAMDHDPVAYGTSPSSVDLYADTQQDPTGHLDQSVNMNSVEFPGAPPAGHGSLDLGALDRMLGKNVDAFVVERYEKYELACERWRDCTMEEWKKGAEGEFTLLLPAVF